jgi:tRNA (cmo5U34)-methyltransferase
MGVSATSHDPWDPDGYLELMHEELPDYEALQAALVAATRGVTAARVLELGVGTGETTRRVLEQHPDVQLVGIDASAGMLGVARVALSGLPVTLAVSRFEDPLPPGPFDLVVSALAIHHLDGPGKASLFKRVGHVLAPGGRFAFGDVVVPDDPADARTPLEEGFDLPSRADAQLSWLRAAGLLNAHVAWQRRDLAVIVADKPA